jgi:hypothetical protein
VIGEEDGKEYKNVPVVTHPITGIVNNPTIISEQGSELIVSAPDLKKLQKHINYPLIVSAINDARNNIVPQRAAGNYSRLNNPDDPNPTDNTGFSPSFDPTVFKEMLKLLHTLNTDGVKARSTFSLSDLKAKQDLEKKSQLFFSKT